MTLAAISPTPSPLTNVESEYVLIAVMLYDGRRIETIADVLRPEHFSEPFLGRIFGLIVAEYGRGNALNALTLRPHIESDPAYEALGGTAFLASLNNHVSLLVDHKGTARQIRDLAKRRELSAGLHEAAAMGADVAETLETAIDAAESALVAATQHSDALRQPTGAQAMRSLIKAAEQPRRSIKSGVLPSIDGLLGGMRPQQLIIGGGRPGMGKTAAALSYGLGAAQGGHGVLFVTLEMGATELAARMAADLAFNGRGGVAYADINSDNPSSRAVKAMGDAAAMLDDMPFQIIDAGSLSVGKLELLVRRFKRRFAAKGQTLDLVIVDYLQLLRTDERRQSAYEAVSEISRRLKSIAKDHDVAVFALAQLSREVEKRSDKKPVLSDLRDSGQIEQDADAVLFFYRHEYYVRQDPATARDQATIDMCAGKIDFICAKRRNGVTGAEVGEFHGAYQAVRG